MHKSKIKKNVHKNFALYLYGFRLFVMIDGTSQTLIIVVKWPGSVHDSRVFRESLICKEFETGKLNSYTYI